MSPSENYPNEFCEAGPSDWSLRLVPQAGPSGWSLRLVLQAGLLNVLWSLLLGQATPALKKQLVERGTSANKAWYRYTLGNLGTVMLK